MGRARAEFLDFSDSGGIERARSVLFDDIDVATSSALWDGNRIREWDADVKVRQKSRRPLEDVPWCMPGGAPIVSDRVRVLFEQHAPEQVQFLPVTITRRGKPIPAMPYWVMNFLCVVDCFDPVRSEYSIEEENGRTKYDFALDGLVIDSKKVPAHVQIFRVEHYEATILIRVGMREILDAAGITGVQYRSVRQVGWR